MSMPPSQTWSGVAVEHAVGQQDHPGTRPVRRQAAVERLAQRLEQLEGDQQLADRRRLAAGDDDAVEPRRARPAGGPRPASAPARLAAPRACSRTSPLQREDPDRARPWVGSDLTNRAGPAGDRPAARSTLMPTIASPRPRLHLRDHVGVVVHRRGLHDRARPRGRVAGLEDAAADEHAVGAELHHHRGVGRGRDAAGGEQHDGQRAGLGDLVDQLVRRLQLLGRDEELVRATATTAGGSRRGSRACG